LVVLQWTLKVGVPLVAPDYAMFGLFGAIICGLFVLLWWLFFSRAPWLERIGVLAVMAVAVWATYSLVDISIAGGAMGNLLWISSIPVLSLALVAACVVARYKGVATRRALTAVAIVLACGWFTLLRTGGVSGDGAGDFHWRWTPTPEQKLLAAAPEPPIVPPAPAPTAITPAPTPLPPAADTKTVITPPAPSAPAEWPGFRGPSRDDVIRGLTIETDWTSKPPVEMWRKPIGPGWSSFAVQGNQIFTQEQRGDDEIVSSYDITTGALVWMHKDRARFYESNAGPGPRGTPAVGLGRVYSVGATGILNALDARNGAVVWSRNAVTDTGATIPGWGIAGSPILAGDTVIVAASGRLAAYDAATGKPRWSGPTNRGGSYSSPHLMTINGLEQLLMQSGAGLTSVSPVDGKVIWQHDWEGVPMLQPVRIGDADLLVAAGDMMGGIGTRRISVASSSGWSAEEKWTSRGLKPYFSDIVAHSGYAYGFDGNILSCIDLKDGARKWKGGRYGSGQLVLLADQDLLLVLAEEGDIALVKATPDGFTEVARHPAIEGKTWNHLVVVRDVLLVRNGEEMVAFRIARPSGSR